MENQRNIQHQVSKQFILNYFVLFIILFISLLSFYTFSKGQFLQEPKITILDDIAEIHFVIYGHVTHIIEENCVTDTTICANFTISVPNYKQIRLMVHSLTHNFLIEVPLADSGALQFVFYFWLYDGEDLLYSEAEKLIIDLSRGKGTNILGDEIYSIKAFVLYCY